MKTCSIIPVLVVAQLLFASLGYALNNVKTENGMVSGYVDGEVTIFKGIPYAAPPTGKLRWKAPEPPKTWRGVKKCETWPASAMQTKPGPFRMWTEEFIAPPEPLSEDCLYLNLWTAAKRADEKRPVIVWIHGGAFVSGAGSCAVYDGTEMAKKGIVFITINYRLGVFGFFSHPELTAESPLKVSGNYGFLDQIAALQWVGKNVAAFGGDPQNVTIAGQSAGSVSVSVLIASPLAKGLFHKAIAQSVGLFSDLPVTTLAQAEKSGEALMERAKASNLAGLRNMKADEIQKASGRTYGPVRDGKTIPFNLTEHFKEGRQNDVPTLTGWVTGDGALVGTPNGDIEAFTKRAKDRYGDKAPQFLEIFPAGSKDQCKASQERQWLISFAALASHQLARFSKHPCFLYEFSFVPTDKPGLPNYGAFHTAEVPFAYHNLNRWKRPWTSTDLKVEEIMSSYWANFARTGNPNGSGLPEWKPYDKETGHVQQLDRTVISKPGLYRREFEFMAQNVAN